MEQTLNIDFGRIYQIARKGINRTACFLGLGLNAGHCPEFNRYQLDGHSAIQLVPQDLDSSKVDEIKKEFCRWVQSNGLRELIEAFCIFLDNLHGACLEVEIALKGSKVDWKREQKKFENGSFDDKLKVLQNRFGVFAPNQECLVSIYKARNCLSHRHGFVGEQDCKSDTSLTVRWHWYKLTAILEDGSCIDIELPIKETIVLEPSGVIRVEGQEKSRKFERGSFVEFTSQELTEICVFVDQIADALKKSAVQYSIGLGATLLDR